MTVRFFPGSKKQKTSLIEGFLTPQNAASSESAKAEAAKSPR